MEGDASIIKRAPEQNKKKKKKNFLTKLPFFLHDILKKHGDYMGISQIASASGYSHTQEEPAGESPCVP